MAKVYNLKVNGPFRQTGTSNTFYITWTWGRPNTESYKVTWEYLTKNGTWFQGNESDEKITQSTYDPPENAVAIRVKVKPVAEKKKSGNKEAPMWTANAKQKRQFKTWHTVWLNSSYFIAAPETPDVGDINTTTGVLTMFLDNLNTTYAQSDYSDTVSVEFQVMTNLDTASSSLLSFKTAVNTTSRRAAATMQLERGKKYRVRARIFLYSVLKKNGKNKIRESAWSDWSDDVSWGPGKISSPLTVQAVSETEVKLTWGKAGNAEGYDIEYTKNEQYFDASSSEVQSASIEGANITTWFISNLENTNAPTWYFRIRATDANGKGEWSNIASTKLATKPSAPVTWTNTVNAKIGERIIFNWSHSSADGSEQTMAQLDVAYRSQWHTFTINGTDQTYSFPTKGNTEDESLQDGQLVKWRVRTKGASSEWSDWSTERELYAYMPPTLGVAIYSTYNWLWDPFNFTTDTIYTAKGQYGGDILESFTKYPLIIGGHASPDGQHALSFAIRVVSNTDYETENEYGQVQRVYAGEEIYSTFIDAPDSNDFTLVLMPNDIDLEQEASYTIYASVAMDSGLTADGEYTFETHFVDDVYDVDADITIDFEHLACYILPHCYDENGVEVTDVTFNIYRQNYDGKFIAIATGISGLLGASVTDPHPALDYGRYRVVAISNKTGGISYNDILSEPIGHNSIVIQWAEAWNSFDAEDLDNPDASPAAASMLDLPYNVDVSAEHAPDVALVSYIGREHPVAYYGTQRGESAQWSCEIKKSDTETLYGIRRLAAYMGDVYIREPSGIGYWANLVVSYQETHNKLTIPVSFKIQRVDGGA